MEDIRQNMIDELTARSDTLGQMAQRNDRLAETALGEARSHHDMADKCRALANEYARLIDSL